MEKLQQQQVQPQQLQQNPQQQQQQQVSQQLPNNNAQYPAHQSQKLGIMITNLHEAITEEFVFMELMNLKINKITNISIKKKFEQCQGYGFIYYESSNLAEEARQKLIGQKWLNKRIQVSIVIPNYKELDKMNCNIYVSNVDPKILPQDFYNFFTQFGPIYSSNLKLKDSQEENAGYGQVFFERMSDAEKCLQSNDQQLKLGEKVVKVTKFQPFDKRNHEKNNIYFKEYHKIYNEEDLKNENFIEAEKVKITEELKKFIENIEQCKSFAIKFNQRFKQPQAFLCYQDHQSANQVLQKLKSIQDFPFKCIDWVKTKQEMLAMKQQKSSLDSNIIYIKNLKEDVTQEQIKKFFDDRAYKTIFCIVKQPNDPKFKNSKFCITKFDKKEDAHSVIINLNNLNSVSIYAKNDLKDIKNFFQPQYKIYVNTFCPKHCRQKFNEIKQKPAPFNMNNSNQPSNQSMQPFFMNNQGSYQPNNQINHYMPNEMIQPNFFNPFYSYIMNPLSMGQNVGMPMPGMGNPNYQNQRMQQRYHSQPQMNNKPVFQQQQQFNQQQGGPFGQQKQMQNRPQQMSGGMRQFNNQQQFHQGKQGQRQNRGQQQYNNINKQQYTKNRQQQQYPNKPNLNIQQQSQPQQSQQQPQLDLSNQQIQQSQSQQPQLKQIISDQQIEEEKTRLLNSWDVLVNASQEEQKNKIGQVLFPLVSRLCKNPKNPPKVTGMLLDFTVFELSEMKIFLENYKHLQDQIQEAETMLEQSNPSNSQQ